MCHWNGFCIVIIWQTPKTNLIPISIRLVAVTSKHLPSTSSLYGVFCAPGFVVVLIGENYGSWFEYIKCDGYKAEKALKTDCTNPQLFFWWIAVDGKKWLWCFCYSINKKTQVNVSICINHKSLWWIPFTSKSWAVFFSSMGGKG